MFVELFKIARSTEEGSRQLVFAALGPDAAKLDSLETTQVMRGGYVSDAEPSEPSPWVLTEDGAKLQAKIWVSMRSC